MKLVDLDVLLYAVNSDAPQHDVVRAWWESALNDEEAVGLACNVLLGFLRLATNPRVSGRPLSPKTAIERIDAWLVRESVRLVRERDDHWETLRALVGRSAVAGSLASAAQLAALALSHDAVLVSCDAGFSRFKGLRRENPTG